MRRLFACAITLLAACAIARAAEPPHSAELDDMIIRQAKRHGVPEKLVRRIVMRESRYNPRARNHSFWGLMQISYPTAKSMGFRGSPTELLDPLVNLTYAVPYLANAFVIAGKEEDAAVRLYASGYYATAKSHNLLGALRTADSQPMAPDESFLVAAAKPVNKLINAVVEGPRPQRVALATPDVPQVPTPAAGAPDGLAPEVMMTAGKTGYAPPKKWVKDGGVTVIARGEQRADQIAAFDGGASAAEKSKKRFAAHGASKKTAEFASLDLPPATAQAYAQPGADPRDGIGQAAPQAAIAQATASTTTSSTAASSAGQVGMQDPASGAATQMSADESPPTDAPTLGKGHPRKANDIASADRETKPATKVKHAHVVKKTGAVVANTDEAETTPEKSRR